MRPPARAGKEMFNEPHKAGGDCGEGTLDSCCLGGGLGRHDMPEKASMTVTPPMTLPGRGWGDGGDRGRRRRSRAGSSCYTYSLADVPAKHRVSGVCGNSGEKNGSTRSTATRDTACISSSSSSSSSSSNCCSGGGGDERLGAAATSSRKGKGSVACFDLSDGFSSAEEETWGSEGEIEESSAAGRHAIVHVHPGDACARACAGLRQQGPSNVALARRDDPARHEAKGVDGSGGGEEDGGVEFTPPLPIDQLDDAQLRLIRAAPFCGSVLAGLRIGDDGSFASVASAAAAAAAASVTRGAPAVGGRRAALGKKSRGSLGGRRVSVTEGGVCDQGERSRSRALRLALPLSIEIENKASEPPPKPGAGAGEECEPRRGRTGIDGQEREGKLAPGRSGGDVEEGDGAESYDEEDLLCGCAERCIRAACDWYRSLALPISLVLGGGVRFSQLEQSTSSPFCQP